MAEGRGGGRESAMLRIQIPRRGGVTPNRRYPRFYLGGGGHILQSVYTVFRFLGFMRFVSNNYEDCLIK